MKYDVADITLAKHGKDYIEWAEKDMPVLRGIRDTFTRSKPFKGVTIGACLHVTAETANLMRTLKAGGADVFLCASNPLSTQDEVAAALVKHYSIPVFAKRKAANKTYFSHIRAVLDQRPALVIDDGADLVSELHKNCPEQAREVRGGMEETTTGVIRLRALAGRGDLLFPVLAINDAMTKHFFDNRYGTGQSTIDGIIRSTNKLLAGSRFVVAGYGWCGRGVAARARGMGAQVVVTEIDPVRALEATLDGFSVMPMRQAVKNADIVCSVTGNKHVVSTKDFSSMKDGCIVCNAGHFDIEINIKELKKAAKRVTTKRDGVEEYEMKDGKKIYVLAQGRLVNLSNAEGHPSSVMDMSFANQALGAEYMLHPKTQLSPDVHTIPEAIDRQIAKLKLASLGVRIDTLTPEQKTYLASWEEGTQ